MPTYDYECEFASPQSCPDCGDLAQRMLTLPAIGGGAQEASGDAPMRSHPGGCACCAAPGRFCAEAV
jgi:hypothetical protein